MMNMKPIESRITEEARRRASEQLKGFSVLSLLEPFALDLETTITIDGPKRTNSGYGNSATLSLSEFDEAFRKSLFNTLTERIAELLLEQFVERTADVDLAAFEIANREPQEKENDRATREWNVTRRTIPIGAVK
jgi:hypothetical protein